MKVAVIGLGLIGASIAKALAGRAEITGIDRDPRTIDLALSQGVISRGGTALSLARGNDIAVIAVPVGSIVSVARDLGSHVGPETVITDTGSTKEQIVSSIDAFWPFFVGSHPIAGKENPGYAASQPDLFSEKTTIITPVESTREESINSARQLWEACGSKVIVMEPSLHDRLMAIISHMPHLLSFTSMGLARDLHIHRDLLGAGFRDFTRIAASDPVMWRDIFLANKHHILKLIDEYIRGLDTLRQMIGSEDSQQLEEMLRTYSSIRRELYENKR